MGVFTFVCRNGGGGEWSAKQIGDEAQLEEASAADIYSLQRRLVQAATSVDSSGAVQSSFSLVTPDSAVFQVIVGGGGGGGGAFIGTGAGAGAGGAAAASGGGAAAAEEKKEEKKEEEKEESDDDMGFSLFD